MPSGDWLKTNITRSALLFAGFFGASASWAGPGDHIQLGEAQLIPSVDLGVEFHTNGYRSATSAVPAVNLRLSPSMALTLNREQVDLSLSGRYEARKYFGKFTNLDRFNDFDIDFRLNAFKQSILGVQLSQSVALLNLPVDFSQGGSGDTFQTRTRSQTGARLAVRAGPALEFTAGALFDADDFRVPSSALFGDSRAFNSRLAYGPTWSAKWSFFPRTAIVVEGQYSLNRWTDTWVPLLTQNADRVEGDFLAIPNSNEFRLKAGLRGRTTPRLVIAAMFGYGSGKYLEDKVVTSPAPSDPTEADPNAAGWAADVSGIDRLLVEMQVKYELGESGRAIAVGYNKDFRDAYFTNYLALNQIYGRFSYRFGQRIGADTDVTANFEKYVGEVQRQDVRLRAKASATVFIQDWASVTAGGGYTLRSSNDTTIEYNDVDLFLHGTFTY